MKKRKISKVDGSYKIYALVDPRDNAVRYVGISIDVDSRFISHLHDSSDLPKATWIRELRAIGMSPTMHILETIEASPDALSLAYQRELHWINEMKRQGYVPLNVYGVTRHDDAARLPMQVSHETPHIKEKLQPTERKEPAKATPRKQRLKVREIAEQQGWTQAKLQRAADVNSRTMSGIWHDPY